MLHPKTRLIIIFAIGLPLSIATFGQGQLGGRQRTQITGIVQTQSGAVVPNATVIVRNKNSGQVSTATSDSEGRFRFADLEPGIYDVEARRNGFPPFRLQDVTVQLNQAVSLNIRFDDTQPIIIGTKALYIRGVVKNNRGGRPIKNATVTIKEVDGDDSWTATTADDGKYVKELPSGEYKLDCKAEGFRRSAEKRQDLRKKSKTQDFRLTPE